MGNVLKTRRYCYNKMVQQFRYCNSKKITPTGRVNTDKGVFAQTEYFDCYRGYGKNRGCELVPATKELIEEVEKQRKEEEEKRREEKTIVAAKRVAYKLSYGEITMNCEMAVELLELVHKYNNV